MAILVTGGAGYIGSHTVLTLLERGEDVLVLDNFINSSATSLERVGKICGRSALVYKGDIRDKEILRRIFDNHDVTSVIHFAGLKAVGESIEKPIEYYDNNVVGTISLIEEMKAVNVTNLIFSSSATVYGNPDTVPVNESFPIGGTTNPYGSSKFIVEKILEDFSFANPEWRITALRYFNPVGAHQSGVMGENPNGIPNNLVPYISQVAVGKLDCVSVFGNDYPTKDGTGVRDYIHVMDLAYGHLAALDKQRNRVSAYKAYNLGTGIGYSVLDIIHAFEKASGLPIKFKFCSRRSGDVSESWSDPSLAKLDLGWIATRNLEEMMMDTWNWQKNNPDGY